MRVVKTSNFSVNGCVLYKSDYSYLIFLPRFFHLKYDKNSFSSTLWNCEIIFFQTISLAFLSFSSGFGSENCACTLVELHNFRQNKKLRESKMKFFFFKSML